MTVERRDHPELRQYIRSNVIFPVSFTIVRLQGDLPGMEWLKGSTQNVSRDGICLETIYLRDAVIEYIARERIYLDLRIQVVMGGPPIKAVGEVVWHQKMEDEVSSRYCLGLRFRSITDEDINQLMVRSIAFSRITGIVMAVCIILFIVVVIFRTFHHIKTYSP